MALFSNQFDSFVFVVIFFVELTLIFFIIHIILLLIKLICQSIIVIHFICQTGYDQILDVFKPGCFLAREQSLKHTLFSQILNDYFFGIYFIFAQEFWIIFELC